ncbi:Hypothetical_protein [Hexamita inflata]|uniref:Hypothetical_protein n=1 Tax=Hexamita inflata TaxID=28002 RepID=A0AA86TJV8_9EUKA|nr:Hypothetical protein HINF_LOCUS5492 [Hexamita inflata]CAI9931124.1 Hypothetical protein HINF_LOCUS18769 [Hexamita inflata]CAI9967552.1 Hypothetical protein HINF_LOCUS55197 [Hexamita inflata]
MTLPQLNQNKRAGISQQQQLQNRNNRRVSAYVEILQYGEASTNNSTTTHTHQNQESEQSTLEKQKSTNIKEDVQNNFKSLIAGIKATYAKLLLVEQKAFAVEMFVDSTMNQLDTIELQILQIRKKARKSKYRQ